MAGSLFLRLLAPVVITASYASAQEHRAPAPVHEIGGVVTDSRGTPIADAEVTLERERSGSAGPIYLAKRTATDGSFSFSRLEPGSATVSVRRLGHLPYHLALFVDALSRTHPVRIPLQVATVNLDTVKVHADERAAIQEFHERRRTRRSGLFIDRAAIERRRAAYTSDLLRSLPGLAVRRTAEGGNTVRVRNCRPAIFIDGTQALNAELDQVTRPADIEGIEVYGSWAGVPPQFSDRFGKSCGMILVWTRTR